MTKSKREYEWQQTENFGKFLHLLWDLGLIQRFLPERQDILILLAMLRYSDFNSGECTVFIGKLADEAGVPHPTQVVRIQKKIVEMGAFWRPEGGKGFKKVNGKWIARYYRSTGKQVLDHALSHNLISEEMLRQIELEQLDEDIRRKAEEALAADAVTESDPEESGLDGVPETIDELIGQGKDG